MFIHRTNRREKKKRRVHARRFIKFVCSQKDMWPSAPYLRASAGTALSESGEVSPRSSA